MQVVCSAAELEVWLPAAEAVVAAESPMYERIRGGESLLDLTNFTYCSPRTIPIHTFWFGRTICQVSMHRHVENYPVVTSGCFILKGLWETIVGRREHVAATRAGDPTKFGFTV